MSKQGTNTRYMQVLAVLCVLALILVVRLFILTTVEHDKWTELSEDMSTRSIYVAAPRGEIYDRYGNLLAGNKQSFSIRLSGSGLTDEQLNETIVKVLAIMDRQGDQLVDEFPIVITDSGFDFIYQSDIDSWLESQGLPAGTAARDAFNALRSNYNIDPALDRYQAQEVLQQQYNQYPPISVSDMEYTQNIEKRNFIQRYFGNDEKAQEMTAAEVFAALREEMNIDESLTDAQARRIMVMRNAIVATGYTQYMPVIVARNISEETVMLLEESRNELPGAEVISETVRYYPNGATASHVLGYVGKITEAEMEAGDGYERDAMVGKTGIEGSMESSLKGINGEEVIQVNARGEMVKMIRKTDVKKGNDIYLTIDLELQKAAERGLEQTLKAIQTGGTVKSKYGDTKINTKSPNAKTGAVVAIDVNTHEVLALASYPDYDPNLFVQGISQENWSALQSKNPRDPLAPAPLYNNATMATVQPGSTFKPITATAALQQGLNPNQQLVDGGYIDLGGHKFACAAWNLGGGTHGAQNLKRALEHSCNYYFYDIATGRDWARGRKLNYTISYKDITYYCDQYGLGKPTGIEIEEMVAPLPSEESRLATLKANVGFILYANAEDYFDERVYRNAELLESNIETMKNWLDEDDLDWNDLYDNKLPAMGVKDKARRRVGEMILYDHYPQRKWSTADTFNLAIGQGENAYTPLQMCNYVATLGNGGYFNEVTLLRSVEDSPTETQTKGELIDIKDKKYIDEIMKGMRLVGSGESSVSGALSSLDVSVAAKTGTAERSGKINPPSEVAYVKRHLSSWLPNHSWKDVEQEMNRLMTEFPETYSTRDSAVRKAVINLSGGKITAAHLDSYKSDYENFAWLIALAPADNPQIAVVVMIPQGAWAANTPAVAKEVIGTYFEKSNNSYRDFTLENKVE